MSLNPAKPILYVLVDRKENADVSGRVLNHDSIYLGKFNSIMQLPALMDAYCNHFKLPQKTHELRTFSNVNTTTVVDRGEEKMAEEKVTAKGEKATFLVTIRYRQNATFQGSIKWLEANEERNFRSELEMMKLMDDAVIDENQDDAKW